MGPTHTHMNLTRSWAVTTTTAIIAGPLHGLAILCTLFRLWYRWSLASLWWDDAWAVIALFADMASLASVILEEPAPGSRYPRSSIGQWIGFCAFPTIMWTTRLSILVSLVRVSQPRVVWKRVAICVGLAFGTMWVCSIAQRLETCIHSSCKLTIAIAAVQTATSCLGDILLTALPIVFLRGMKLRRKCKILILSTFSASMVINVVTIVHATMLFNTSVTPGAIIVAHVKTALSMIVCNLLVIVTFIYRILHRGHCLEGSGVLKSRDELTTVELSQVVRSQESGKEAVLSVCSSGTARSSTWSFKFPGPMASKPSSAVTETARVEAMQGDIFQEER